jgi:hypothetical protein
MPRQWIRSDLRNRQEKRVNNVNSEAASGRSI